LWAREALGSGLSAYSLRSVGVLGGLALAVAGSSVLASPACSVLENYDPYLPVEGGEGQAKDATFADAGIDALLDGGDGGEEAAEAGPSCTAQNCPVGCCDEAGACQDGNRHEQCGTRGMTCFACSAATPSCDAGVCTADCSGCDAGLCCVSTDGGACVEGNQRTTCGSGAACVDCTGSSKGQACVNSRCGCKIAGDCLGSSDGHLCTTGAVCGCKAASDCPLYSACGAGNVCGIDCSPGSPCNGGCCDPKSGKCVDGTGNGLCGNAGEGCLDCSMGSDDTRCVNGACGCKHASDCRKYEACDKTMHLCDKTCAGAGECHGGCCGGGQCRRGDSSSYCGLDGGVCAACGSGTCTSSGVCLGGAAGAAPGP